MKTIGISLYLDYYSLQDCKKMIDNATVLGYKDIFTSLNFEEYTFPGKRNTSKQDMLDLIAYADNKGMKFHADITRNLLYKVGGTVDDLSYFKQLHIPVIRLDGGFTIEEIVTLTKNPLGIIIEDNLSNYDLALQALEAVVKDGNPLQYSGCLNFFPRNYTGLDLKEAIAIGKKFQEKGCLSGAFIGSLYSPTQMNDTGVGTPSIEAHRFLPSYIQMYELLCCNAFDFILFGDTCPTQQELQEVANAFACYKQGYIELPCYFENIDKDTLNKIKSCTMLSRVDHSALVIRAMETRGILLEPYNTVEKQKYAITIDNTLSYRYAGELQIVLADKLPAERNVNVIGMVKPYATRLLDYIHNDSIKFKLI